MRFVFGSTTMSAGQYGSGVPLAPPFVSLLFGPFAPRGADLVDERAVGLELDDVRIVAEIRRPRKLAVEVARLAVAGDIDEVVVIHVDAVLARGPHATVRLAALRLQEFRIARAAPRLQ